MAVDLGIPKRSLILSSSEHELELLVEQVKGLGIDACATTSIDEAVGVLGALSDLDYVLDFVIIEQDSLDAQLDGFVENINNHTSGYQTPIIAIASDCSNQQINEAVKAQLVCVLGKPCAPSLLEETVKRVISGEQGQAKQPKDDIVASDYGIDVLIAEDNEVNQIVFTEIMHEMGVSYKIANNGQEAVELWSQHNPAIVMMDLSMPVMNGLEAMKEIRRREDVKGTHTPICAITAHALKGDREDCLNAGMDDYLSKPISPDIMIEKVRSLLPKDHPFYASGHEHAA